VRRSPLRAARKALGWSLRPVARRLRSHGLVLLYHRVAHPSLDPWNICVRPEHFDAHVIALRRHADVVPLPDLPAAVRARRPGQRPAAAITFDDGYVDNLEQAAPILARREAPATVFLATGFIGRAAPFWWDRLAWVLLGPARLPDLLELELPGGVLRWRGPVRSDGRRATRVARMRLHDRIWRELRMHDDAARDAALDRLAGWSGSDARSDVAGRPMTGTEVRKLVATGVVAAGAHSVSHAVLPELDRERKAREIVDSIDRCEELAGVRPDAFAYPHGRYDDEAIALVRDAGLTVACVGREDLVWRGAAEHALPRLSVHDWSGAAFERWLRWYWLP
jgi:peptidoglycan/xylan/chitin deacetylase (PgdA/CDA1 family)